MNIAARANSILEEGYGSKKGRKENDKKGGSESSTEAGGDFYLGR